MTRVINSGKSERKLWLKFSVLVLKGLKILSVIVNSGFSNLFFDIWIQIPNADPDQVQIEC